MKYNSVWIVRHIRDGKVIWEDEKPNSLVQEGEESILETYFLNGATYIPTEFYVRLCNDDLLITSTLSTVSDEPVGNGYDPQLLERSGQGFPTKELSGGIFRIVSKVISFTADGGSIGPVRTAYLSTTSDNTGKLIAFRGLTLPRTVLSGDTMTLQFRIELS